MNTIGAEFRNTRTRSIPYSIALYMSTSGADFPPVKSYAWRDDKTLEVIFSLEPSHQYGFVVMGTEFPTKDGHSAGKNTEINFTTGK